jgi:hypothetical protein
MCRNVVEGQRLGKFVQHEDLRADIYKLKTRKLIEIKKTYLLSLHPICIAENLQLLGQYRNEL